VGGRGVPACGISQRRYAIERQQHPKETMQALTTFPRQRRMRLVMAKTLLPKNLLTELLVGVSDHVLTADIPPSPRVTLRVADGETSGLEFG
jgi:hypothetical protein